MPPPIEAEAVPDEHDVSPSLMADEIGGGVGGPQHRHCLSLLRNALSCPDQLTAMISNYSTSYNAVNVGIVLPVLSYSLASQQPYSSPGLADYSALFTSHAYRPTATSRRLDGNPNEETDGQESLVASSLLAGMILGQLAGGYLGDVVGRRNAMMLVLLMQIVGSLGSALLVSTQNELLGLTTLEQLSVWRFILGIGAGGVYPLAAVMSAENNKKDVERDAPQSDRPPIGETEWSDEDERIAGDCPTRSDEHIGSFQRIALTFSTQGLGFITVPLVAYPMLEWRWNVDVIWRMLLGAGALPGLVVMYMRLCAGKFGGCKGKSEKALAHPLEDGALHVQNDLDTVDDGNEAGSDNEEMPSAPEGERSSAISTLFSDDTISDSNGDPAEQHENERALVDNCHLEVDDSCAENDEAPSNLIIMEQPRGLWQSIQAESNLGTKLAGTAGTWFLFDVLFYGNTLFEPLVLEAAFGTHSSSTADGYELLQTTVRDSLVISLLSLPGYFVTVLLIGRQTCVCRSIRSSSSSTRCGSALCSPCYQTPAYIQSQGFFWMFLLYFIIGVAWSSLSGIQGLLICLYAGTFFFANYGPNTTTFLLPSVTYSEECRSTLNGISAAAGKSGAFLGSILFAPAADSFGESAVMIACSFVSLLALLLTRVCLREKCARN
ncbi:hypothetical protein ACHAXT_009241 [Thalassiosira profunda]